MRAVWPEPSPADLSPGSAIGVSEVSRFSCMKFLGVPWVLRPRRTEQKLALSLLSMLPSAHLYRVGVRVVCFRGSIPTPPILYLRFAGSLTVAAQDSRPSGSLLLSCKALSSSTFMPVYPGALTSPSLTMSAVSSTFLSTLRHAPREERYFALVEICQANLGLASNRSGQELSPTQPSLRSQPRS